MDENKVEQGFRDQIKEYRELQAVAEDQAFIAYFDLQLKRAAEKMITAFTSDNVKDWNDFCKLRGEVVARLQPIQEIHSIEAIIANLQQQLEVFKQQQ